MTVSFADTSHNNAGVSLTAYAATHDRVALKASEGTGFIDPMFGDRWRQAGQLGLHRIAYHFDRAQYDGGAQFAWFIGAVNRAGGLRPGDMLCLDSEDINTPARASTSAAAFTHAAAAAGYPGCVYTGRWYANPYGITAGILHPSWRWLWLSDYTASHDDATMPLPNGWARSQVIARQFTSTAAVPGVTGDCDYSRVLADWLADAPTPEDDMDADQDKLLRDTAAAVQRISTYLGILTYGDDADDSKDAGTHPFNLQAIRSDIAGTVAAMRALQQGQQALADAITAMRPTAAGDLQVTGTLHVTEGTTT